MPESLAKDKRRDFDFKRANPFGTFTSLLKVEGIGVLAIVYFFVSLAGFVYPAVWSYVAIAKFGWNEAQIGLSLAAYGLLFVINQAAVVPVLMPRLGERRAIWIALVLEVIMLAGIATAPNTAFVYIWLLPALITGMAGPALQKVMTERVADDAQGELQGGLSALGSLVLILSPLIYTGLFFLFEEDGIGIHFPGAPFIAASIFCLIALVFYLAREKKVII